MREIVLHELLDVDWRVQGGDWMTGLETGIRERFGWNWGRAGNSADPETHVRSSISYRFSGTPQGVISLRVEPKDPRGLRLVLIVSDDFDEAGLERWRSMTLESAARLPSQPVDFEWEALLGIPNPTVTFPDAGSIGPIRAYPVEVEVGRTDLSTAAFVPIKLAGTTPGLSWLDIKSSARRQARLFAAVLTVEWDDLARLWQEVSCSAAGEPPGPGTLEAVAYSIPPGQEKKVLSVPGWASDVLWAALTSDVNLSNALLAYHEGRSLEMDDHPSFAFAAYCASMEALGARVVDLEPRCPECGFMKGAALRFRTALQLAMPREAHLKQLNRMYHNYRSGTVHSALFHGGEDGGRSQTPRGNPFIFDEEVRFSVGLAMIRIYARRALAHVLRDVAGTE